MQKSGPRAETSRAETPSALDLMELLSDAAPPDAAPSHGFSLEWLIDQAERRGEKR
ncbi:MAG: hypothetical protein AAGF90_16835 [Pseudomonadota bacterium]